MTDLATQRNILRRLEQTQVVERPGASGQNTFYEIGVWTPAFTGTTIAGTFTYGAQTGVYTRIGNQVFMHAFIAISAIAVAPTGNMSITGLPFTAASVGMDFSITFGYLHNINVSAAIIQLTGFVQLATARILLMESFDNAAAAQYPAANFTNAGAAIELSGVYQV